MKVRASVGRGSKTAIFATFACIHFRPSGARGESKLSYSIDKRAAEMVIYCYLLTTSRQLPDFQAAPKPSYLPLSTDVLHQNSGTP